MEHKIIFSKKEFDEFKSEVFEKGSNHGFWKAVAELRHCYRYNTHGVFGDKVNDEQKAMWIEVTDRLLGLTKK